MEHFKKGTIILIPNTAIEGSYKSGIYLSSANKLHRHNVTNGGREQHLCITTQEEIAQGDIVYDSYDMLVYYIHKTTARHPHQRKIIAITDKSKKVTRSLIAYTETRGRTFYSEESLPSISQQFIEEYIDTYNKGEIITEVLVEYEIDKQDVRNQYKDCPSGKYWEDIPNPPSSENLYSNAKHCIIKVNPEDGTLNIKKIKSAWTREEMLAFGLKCGIAGTLAERSKTDFNKLYLELVEKNL